MSNFEAVFYSSDESEPIRILPKILQKAYETNLNALVVSSNSQIAKSIDDVLWTYSQKVFLPHAMHDDPMPARQPIIIGFGENHNLNDAKIIATIEGMTDFDTAKYKKIIDIFDHKSEESLKSATGRMRYYQSLGAKLAYWHQNIKGNWNEASNDILRRTWD